MKKQTLAIFLVLAAIGLFATAAAAQKTHSVWTNNNGLVISDPTARCNYNTYSGFEMITSWTQPSPPNYPAEAHFRGVGRASGFSCRSVFYEFRLVESAATDADSIFGAWNVYRNGTLVCNGCKGTAYGLSATAGVGNYYKVYIDDPVYGPSAWLYSGYIDGRKDF